MQLLLVPCLLCGVSSSLVLQGQARGGRPPRSARGQPRCCAAEPDAGEESDGLSESDLSRLTTARASHKASELYSANVRRRKPRFLSFVQARAWARAMWFTEEADWRRMIYSGELRNPYIPSKPDEVYQSQWVSWEDFLTGDVDRTC